MEWNAFALNILFFLTLKRVCYIVNESLFFAIFSDLGLDLKTHAKEGSDVSTQLKAIKHIRNIYVSY